MSKKFLYLIPAVFICLNAIAQDSNFKSYTQKIGGSPQVYDMVAIPGGEFTMGSPAAEKGRRADEGPQHKVKIEPFWMGKT
jgi:formylglycine-generating enzyme required for sulfatase activity